MAFWTLTLWEEEQHLRQFVAASPHRETIPKLYPWCDEAVTTHWHVNLRTMPSWDEATDELLRAGRLLRVKHPSRDQLAQRIIVT